MGRSREKGEPSPVRGRVEQPGRLHDSARRICAGRVEQPGRLRDSARRICAGLIAWMLLAAPLAAQEKQARLVSFEGPEVFCHILNELGLKPIAGLKGEPIDPKQTLIVLFGQTHKLDDIQKNTGGLHRFLEQGGSLLIATDRHLRIPDLRFGIAGEQVQRPLESAYRQESVFCPMLTYSKDVLGWEEQAAHPLFRFLKQGIATNCPSRIISIDDQKAKGLPLLQFPLIRRDDEFFVVRETYMAGSPQDAPPEGRALYIAGHGMFMNGMMLQEDNDNFAFAINAVKWLREGPSASQRTKALVMVDGEIITNFDTKLTPPMPPIPLPTVRKIDRLLRGIENEGLIPRFLAEHLDLQRMVAIGLALATFALLLYGAKKFMEGRHLPETKVPLMVGPHAVPAGTPRMRRDFFFAAIIGTRIDALIRKNHLTKEARATVHEWFRDQFATTPGEAELRAEATADLELRRQVDFVMRLVRSNGSIKVTRAEFRWLVESLPQLAQAVREKHVALLVDGKNVRQPQVT